MKHTPGPWKWKQNRGNNYYEHSVFTDHQTVAELDGEMPVNIKANAALIAAAPDLLEALKLIVKAFADGDIKFTEKRRADSDPYHPANVAMCAAIAKAEGGE